MLSLNDEITESGKKVYFMKKNLDQFIEGGKEYELYRLNKNLDKSMRDKFNRFVELVQERSKSGESMKVEDLPDELQKLIKDILWRAYLIHRNYKEYEKDVVKND